MIRINCVCICFVITRIILNHEPGSEFLQSLSTLMFLYCCRYFFLHLQLFFGFDCYKLLIFYAN